MTREIHVQPKSDVLFLRVFHFKSNDSPAIHKKKYLNSFIVSGSLWCILCPLRGIQTSRLETSLKDMKILAATIVRVKTAAGHKSYSCFVYAYLGAFTTTCQLKWDPKRNRRVVNVKLWLVSVKHIEIKKLLGARDFNSPPFWKCNQAEHNNEQYICKNVLFSFCLCISRNFILGLLETDGGQWHHFKQATKCRQCSPPTHRL